MNIKPTIEEVCAYAKPLVRKFIGKYANDIPFEHKQEIEQCCYIRLIEAYPNIDPNAGWKSFVYNHSRGSVLDYLKFGKGYEEHKWSLNNEINSKVPKLKERIFLSTSDGDDLDLDTVLGQAGIFCTLDLKMVNIRWDIISRMASTDEKINVFARWLKGWNLEELSSVVNLSKAQITKLIQEFVNQFDDPSLCENSPWVRQTIYAFGLCGFFGMKDINQEKIFNIDIDRHLLPVNLDSEAKFSIDSINQMSLFDLINEK